MLIKNSDSTHLVKITCGPQGNRLSDLSPELLLLVMSYLDPFQVLSLRKVSRALYRASNDRQTWMALLRQLCNERDVYLPSYNFSDLSLSELEKATCRPHLLESLLLRPNPDGTDHVPISLSSTILDDTNAADRNSLRNLYFIPGGRFLLGFSPKRIQIWDLIDPTQPRRISSMDLARTGRIINTDVHCPASGKTVYLFAQLYVSPGTKYADQGYETALMVLELDLVNRRRLSRRIVGLRRGLMHISVAAEFLLALDYTRPSGEERFWGWDLSQHHFAKFTLGGRAQNGDGAGNWDLLIQGRTLVLYEFHARPPISCTVTVYPLPNFCKRSDLTLQRLEPISRLSFDLPQNTVHVEFLLWCSFHCRQQLPGGVDAVISTRAETTSSTSAAAAAAATTTMATTTTTTNPTPNSTNIPNGIPGGAGTRTGIASESQFQEIKYIEYRMLKAIDTSPSPSLPSSIEPNGHTTVPANPQSGNESIDSPSLSQGDENEQPQNPPPPTTRSHRLALQGTSPTSSIEPNGHIPAPANPQSGNESIDSSSPSQEDENEQPQNPPPPTTPSHRLVLQGSSPITAYFHPVRCHVLVPTSRTLQFAHVDSGDDSLRIHTVLFSQDRHGRRDDEGASTLQATANNESDEAQPLKSMSRRLSYQTRDGRERELVKVATEGDFHLDTFSGRVAVLKTRPDGRKDLQIFEFFPEGPGGRTWAVPDPEHPTRPRGFEPVVSNAATANRNLVASWFVHSPVDNAGLSSASSSSGSSSSSSSGVSQVDQERGPDEEEGEEEEVVGAREEDTSHHHES